MYLHWHIAYTKDRLYEMRVRDSHLYSCNMVTSTHWNFFSAHMCHLTFTKIGSAALSLSPTLYVYCIYICGACSNVTVCVSIFTPCVTFRVSFFTFQTSVSWNLVLLKKCCKWKCLKMFRFEKPLTCLQADY